MVRQRASGIVIKDNKILFVMDSRATTKCTIPGGGVEVGESLVEAVKREFLEELSVDILVGECLVSYSYVNEVTGEENCENIFLVTLKGNPVCFSEIVDFVYASLDDITSEKVVVFDAFKENTLPILIEKGLLS